MAQENNGTQQPNAEQQPNNNGNGEPKRFWDRPIVKWTGRVLIAAGGFVGGMFFERKRGKKS